MKKFIITVYLISSLFILFSSCNKEEINTDNIKKIEGETLDPNKVLSTQSRGSNLVTSVANSSEFKLYLESSNLFYEKLNIKNNIIIFNDFTNIKEIDAWVDENISLTYFASLNEYNNLKNNLNNNKFLFINRFYNDFQILSSDPSKLTQFENELSEVIYDAEIAKLPTSSVGCANSAIRCVKRAASNAAAGLAASAISAIFNPIVGVAGALATYIYLNNAIEGCMDAFDSCMG